MLKRKNLTLIVSLVSLSLVNSCVVVTYSTPAATTTTTATTTTATTTTATAAFTTLSVDKAYGWTSSTGAALSFALTDSGVAGAKYECRSGPSAAISSKSWGYCDGGVGTTLVAYPTLDAGTPSGTYKIQARLVSGSYTSAVGSQGELTFYVHTSLNNVATCADEGTDAAAITAASTALGAITGTFGSSSVTSVPFVRLDFDAVALARSNESSATANLLSLRRRFVLSSDRKLVLVRRAYRSTKNANCNQYFTKRDYQATHCSVFVGAADGRAVCLAWNSGSSTYSVAYQSTTRVSTERAGSNSGTARTGTTYYQVNALDTFNEGTGLGGVDTTGFNFKCKRRTGVAGSCATIQLPD